MVWADVETVVTVGFMIYVQESPGVQSQSSAIAVRLLALLYHRSLWNLTTFPHRSPHPARFGLGDLGNVNYGACEAFGDFCAEEVESIILRPGNNFSQSHIFSLEFIAMPGILKFSLVVANLMYGEIDGQP